MQRKRLKSYKQDRKPESQMVMRMVAIRRDLANEDTQTIPVIIATETPVERYNPDTGEVYQEILDMQGVQFRANRQQLPIVDSHDRSTVRNVLGSIRNLRIEGDMLVGDASFARDADSQIAYQKLLDGHLTDFSITADPLEGRTLKRGEHELWHEQEVVGPAVIISAWSPTDASLVAAGADENSTVRSELMRSYDLSIRGETKRMISEEMREALVAKGMPEQIENADEALAWMTGYLDSIESAKRAEAEEEAAVSLEADEGEEMKKEADSSQEEVAHVKRAAAKAEIVRQKEIRAIFSSLDLGADEAERLCDDPDVSIERAREVALDKIKTRKTAGAVGSGPTVVREGRDDLMRAMRSGLISRALQGSGARNREMDKADIVSGYRDFERMSLMRMVERHLNADGIDTMRLEPRNIAMVALGHRPTIERLQNSGIIRSAYHTTGSFANLLLDAANKTLLRGYDEAIYTWSLWARQAPSVADFKDIHRIRFSESPDLMQVPENDNYPEGAMSDSKESYRVEKFGRVFSVTWETVVNDDLDAISRIPMMHGNAARRTQNKKVYEVLTSNPLMGDGQNLFSASHASGTNVSGGAAAPSVTTLNAGFLAMMRQKGLNSDVIINVQPRYLIVPANYAATAMQVVGSIADPSVGGSVAGNSNTLNIYGPNGTRPLQVVAEPQLDSASSTVWYLAADSSQIDTVELSFLQGEEAPVLENEWDFDRDVYKYKVRQTFGVKAIDWRGLFRNAA
jgi:hypothetical protein